MSEAAGQQALRSIESIIFSDRPLSRLLRTPGDSNLQITQAQTLDAVGSPMPQELLIPTVLAASFTLGCLGIHWARRYPDAVALTLILLFGFIATLYVGRHAHIGGHRTAEHAGPDYNWTAELKRATL